MGNICRSPTAEAVFTSLVANANLQSHIQIDSAGTHAYHIGEAPDTRSIAAGLKRGYALAHLVARQVNASDFEVFDYIVAMDKKNHQLLISQCPDALQYKISLLLEHIRDVEELEVPDPYYGGEQGFFRVIDLVESGAKALLEKIRKEKSV